MTDGGRLGKGMVPLWVMFFVSEKQKRNESFSGKKHPLPPSPFGCCARTFVEDDASAFFGIFRC